MSRFSFRLLLLAALAAPVAVVPSVVHAQSPAARSAGYKLGPGDQIRVSVKDFPEFNVEPVTVPPDGVLSLPFYGRVRATGRTTADIENSLRNTLRRELKQPRVAVTLTQPRSLIVGRVFISGAVTTPGPVDIQESTRLSQVIAAAGGLGGRLEEKRATLSRRGGPSITLNLAAAIAQPNSPANVRLRPDDAINVSSIAPGRVTIAGDVGRPGLYTLHREPQPAQNELSLRPRLADALLLAGGLGGAAGGPSTSGPDSGTEAAEGGASEVSAPGRGRRAAQAEKFEGTLQRGGRIIPLNVQEALRNVSGAANVQLQAGDLVTVRAVPPPQPIKVYVGGFVGRTGPFTVAPGTRLLQVLTEAGGLTRTADNVVTSVRRGAQAIPVDLQAVYLNSGSRDNIELQAGDTVQVSEPPIIRVRADGSVVKSGELRLRPGATLREALLEAGSLSIKPEDARLNVLRKEDDGTQKIMSANASDLLELRSVQDNIELREGDQINVSPIKLQTVFVTGEVGNPGALEVREGENLAQLLTRAGNVKPTASLSRIVIDRGGKTIQVDAYDALKNGAPLNFPVLNGDRVIVPENPNYVVVLEAVGNPGKVAIPERGQLTLQNALAEAGGPSQRTKEIILVRGQQEIKIPIAKVRSGVEGRQVLRPRDVIYVPATVQKTSVLDTIGRVLGPLGFFLR